MAAAIRRRASLEVLRKEQIPVICSSVLHDRGCPGIGIKLTHAQQLAPEEEIEEGGACNERQEGGDLVVGDEPQELASWRDQPC